MTTSAGRSRGTYAKTPQRRREILSAAAEVFTEHGYGAASMRQIAARVGISETGLAHHFDSKTDLVLAVLQERAREDSAQWGAGGVVPVERLAGLMAHNAERPGMVRLFTKLAAEATSEDSPAHDYFAERYERLRRSAGDDIRRAQQQGRLRADLDAEVVARILLAVMDGLQVQWLYDQDVSMPEAMDLLLGSWLRPDAG